MVFLNSHSICTFPHAIALHRISYWVRVWQRKTLNCFLYKVGIKWGCYPLTPTIARVLHKSCMYIYVISASRDIHGLFSYISVAEMYLYDPKLQKCISASEIGNDTRCAWRARRWWSNLPAWWWANGTNTVTSARTTILIKAQIQPKVLDVWVVDMCAIWAIHLWCCWLW